MKPYIKPTIKHLSISFTFLFLISITLQLLGYLPPFWEGRTIYLFYIALFFIFLHFLFKIQSIPQNQRDNSSLIKFISYMFLLSLATLAINQFLKRQFILDYQIPIITLSIALGILTFYSNRERVENELEEEKKKEESEEKRRRAEFGAKFPRLNRIWGLRRFVKWMYGEGWSFSIPLVIITIIFIAIKIAMPIIYTGSYIDEYNHILSGIEFFETGHFAEIYKGEYYNRGTYVSFMVGLFFKLFGQTIFVAKMVPALIGIVNFFLLYKIARNFIEKRIYIILLMIIYTISPWIIFNHFYIRMYVFYEFFLLLITLLFVNLINNITNKIKFILYFSSILILLSMLYFFSFDDGIYLILLYASLFFIYILFFEMQKINIRNIVIRFILYNRKKFVLLFLFILLLFIYSNGLTLIKFLIYGTLHFTSPNSLKYDYYFFDLNAIFTVFFILSIALIFSRISYLKKILIFSSGFLFFVHMISSPDLQIFRAIIYFLPNFYIVSIFALRNISRLYHKLIVIFMILFIILNIYGNYPDNFLKTPFIPSEVNYRDYEKISYYANSIADEDTVIISHFPHIYRFYNPKIDNQIWLLRDNNESFYDERLKYRGENQWFYTPSKDLIITNSEILSNLTKSDRHILFLSDDGLYNSWTLEDSRFIINSSYNLKNKFSGVTIYEK